MSKVINDTYIFEKDLPVKTEAGTFEPAGIADKTVI